MALKLVLEPIFEPDQYQSSYAYRPGRRTWDALAEVVHFINNGYQWVIEGDVENCFDAIPHRVVVERVCRRVTDRRILGMVKACLKAGVLTGLGRLEQAPTGTPQGGITSPLFANLALSGLRPSARQPRVWEEPAERLSYPIKEPVNRRDERRETKPPQDPPQPPGRRDVLQHTDPRRTVHQPDPCRLDELPGFLDLVLGDAGGIGRGRLVVPAQERQSLPAIQPGDEPRRSATERSTAIEQ